MCFVVIPFLDAISSVCPLDNFPSGFCRIDGVLYCRIGEPHSFVGCVKLYLGGNFRDRIASL